MKHLQHITGRLTLWTLVAFALLLSACDAEDSPNKNSAALYDMSYRVSNVSPDVPAGNLRAAFIWTYNVDNGGIAGISRDIPISAEFPSSFKLEIFDLPPAITMSPVETFTSDVGDYDCGGMPDLEMYTPEEAARIIEEEGIVPCPEEPEVLSGVKWSIGRMVVYSDNNNNGQLDKLAPEDNLEDIVDQIVGPTEQVIVIYVEGNPAGTALANDFGVTAGFNLLIGDAANNFSPVAINTELPITLAVDNEMQSLMCEEPVEGPRDSSGSTMGQFITSLDQAPADATLSCSADGLTGTFSKSEITEGTLCTSYSAESLEWIMILDAPAQAPADWPCTIL